MSGRVFHPGIRLGVGLCMGWAVGCGSDPGGGSGPGLDEPPEETVLAPMPDPARRGRATPAGYVGVVVRERRVVVSAPFSARLLERHVQPGQEVEAGQPLARFDSESVDRALAVAEAAVRETEAALAVAEVEAEQAEARYRRRENRRELFSAEQLEDVEAEVEVTRARRVSAEARLASVQAAAQQARSDAERAVLRAPLAGIVDAVYGSPGAVDERGAPVVAIEAGDFHVRFAASPRDAEDLAAGHGVEVWAEGPEPIAGFVIYASPELDPRTLLLTFEAMLCAEDLPAGTPVRVVAAETAAQTGCPDPVAP